MKRAGMVALIAGLAVGTLLSIGPAGSSEPCGSDSGDAGFSGPYCGLYSVYAAARLNGLEPMPDGITSLLKPEFIGSPAGASATELVAAAGAMGMRARIFTGLTRLDLAALSAPAVLHVRSDLSAEAPDHWLLLVSCNLTEAVLIDEGSVPARVPIASLCARWDGLAIVVSSNPIAATARWPTVAAALTMVLGLIGCPVLFHRLVIRCASISRWLPGALVVAGSIVAVGALSAALNWNQPIWESPARQAVVDRHLDQFLPAVTTQEVLALSKAGSETVLVDARDAGDFKDGHIPGARSLPVWAPDTQLKAFIEALRPDQTIVIYCQSRQCTFSAMLAARFRAHGWERLAIYHDGWTGWSEAGDPKAQ